MALGKDGCKFNFSMLRSAHMCKAYRIGAVRITIGTADKKELLLGSKQNGHLFKLAKEPALV